MKKSILFYFTVLILLNGCAPKTAGMAGIKFAKRDCYGIGLRCLHSATLKEEINSYMEVKEKQLEVWFINEKIKDEKDIFSDMILFPDDLAIDEDVCEKLQLPKGTIILKGEYKAQRDSEFTKTNFNYK
jgi:hypothetical protein